MSARLLYKVKYLQATSCHNLTNCSHFITCLHTCLLIDVFALIIKVEGEQVEQEKSRVAMSITLNV